jgi:copper chaperone
MTTTLRIDGMSCNHCVKRVTQALAAVPGATVREVGVGHATIEHAAPGVPAAAVQALDEAGYPARAASEGAA